MKKILALAALMAVTPLFAAQNTFTFKVNSSGTNMHVCGFYINGERAYANSGNLFSTSNATFTVNKIDEWEDKPLDSFLVDVREELGNDKGALSWHKKYWSNFLGTRGYFYEMEDLNIDLNDEYYGFEYTVDVCYHIPMYMDLSQVKFDVKAEAQFTNLADKDRNYLDKGKVQGKVLARLFPSYVAKARQEVDNIPMANGNFKLDMELDWLGATLGTTSERGVIVTSYTFKETSNDRRPHVAHGGLFTLDTTVTPVAK